MRPWAFLSLFIWTVTSLAFDVPDGPTTFNGEEVPRMPDLKGQDLAKIIERGNWLVEFYSPQCGHCAAMAPTWQTMYEFYYTLKPVVGSSKSDAALNTFTRYYDFKFGRIDCVAFGDGCTKAGAKMAFPEIAWFQDGKFMKSSVGSKSLKDMSTWFEEILESIRPGSRPQGGPNLPDVSDSMAPTQPTPISDSGSGVVLTKPMPTYNPEGISAKLNSENFKELVTESKEPWLVKFYAPWCHHCQAMASAWTEMARDIRGSLNIGEVNCDVESKLCKDMEVRSYPTIYFIKNGEKVEYDGLRRLGDLVTYAQSCAQASLGIEEVNVEAFRTLEKKEDVIFIYFYDEAAAAEDFAALDRVVLSAIGHGTLVKSKDPELAKLMRVSTKPCLKVSRDGIEAAYPYISPKDTRNYRQVLDWMKSTWHPLVPELSAINAHDLMQDALIVLGVLSRDRETQFNAARSDLKRAAKNWIEREKHADTVELQELRDAKQLKIDEAKGRKDEGAVDRAKGTKINITPKPRVRFAWVDGVFWEKWLQATYNVNVKSGESVIVIDENNHLYWDTTEEGTRIQPTNKDVLNVLPLIIKKPYGISAKSSASSWFISLFYWLKAAARNVPWVNIALICGFAFGCSIVYRQNMGMWAAAAKYLPYDDSEKGYSGISGGKVD